MISRTPSAARMAIVIPALLAILGVLAIISLGTGSATIAAGRVISLLADAWSGVENGPEAVIVRQLRPPRLVLAIIVGASLSLSGAVMQGFFQNPMADPYIVGVSAGAALGATAALSQAIDFWALGVHSTSVFAFAGALGVTFLVYGISVRGGRVPVSVLLLTGVAVGSLAAALTSVLLITSEGHLHRIIYWLLGSLASRRWEHVRMIWPFALAGAVVVHLFARDLNLILQGEENAQHLGVQVERVKRILLVATALLTAAAVAVSGIIGFVGLVVPHVMRMVVGPDHRRLFPASALGGAILLVAADIVARSLFAPTEVPVGVITSILGCPFFLYLLSRRRETSL